MPIATRIETELRSDARTSPMSVRQMRLKGRGRTAAQARGEDAWREEEARATARYLSGCVMSVLGHIFTQGAVDAGLIALAVRRMAFEPIDNVSIQAQG